MTDKHTIPLSVTLSNRDIDDILTSAFEGGIGYWCRIANPKDGDFKGADYASEVLTRGGTVILSVTDEEPPDDSVELTLDKFLTGFAKWLQSGIRGTFRVSTDPSNIDADDADAIVQFAVFGEIVYS